MFDAHPFRRVIKLNEDIDFKLQDYIVRAINLLIIQLETLTGLTSKYISRESKAEPKSFPHHLAFVSKTGGLKKLMLKHTLEGNFI